MHVSRWGNGRGRLLFTYIVLLGAAVAALFANDGAALILTPIVIAMLLALGFKQRTTLAFRHGCRVYCRYSQLCRLSCPTWLTSFLQTFDWASPSMRR
ncbi:ArsB/NhaD family transporter [Klebsiella quasipneumoniae]|uniref:ArsB/NhaD family transporter n=1 Tax=Klebsiella quasipneumoniae TaxID=1463165 RepID=UPI00389053A3